MSTLTVLLLLAVCGCGGPPVINISSLATTPVTFAVYYLSRPGALSGIPSTDLINKANYGSDRDVVDVKKNSVPPGVDYEFPLIDAEQEGRPKIVEALVVANFKEGCAQKRVPFSGKKIRVVLDQQHCITVSVH